MTIRSPAQAEGFTQDHLLSSVMEAFRFMRDDPLLLRMKPSKERIAYLDESLKPFADNCGVPCQEFKSYMGDLLSLK